MNPKFWQGKRVFLTGHTGFKGSWIGAWLTRLDAKVTGFSLAPETTPSHFALLPKEYESLEGDIRDFEALSRALRRTNPDVVLHMAAQSLVRASYADPVPAFDFFVEPSKEHEANLLTLDSEQARRELGWKPRWGIEIALEKTLEWYASYRDSGELLTDKHKQIQKHMTE